MEVFDHAYEDYQDSLNDHNECSMCGMYISEDKKHCSETCRRADND